MVRLLCINKFMKNVIFYTKYSSIGASSRLRTYQYKELFDETELNCSYSSLFDDEYLNNLYSSGNRSKSMLIVAYFKRFKDLFKIISNDIIYIEKELFPYVPFFEFFLFSLLRKPIFLDFDDAIFHNYDKSSNFFIRFTLSKKLINLSKKSSAILCGNKYIMEYFIKNGSPSTHLIPTSININKYSKNINQLHNTKTVIGWIGTPETAKYLDIIHQALLEISKKYSIVVKTIGAKFNFDPSIEYEYIKWKEISEIEEIDKFDIGVMPLYDSPFEKGKCGYKLIQYMGCSKPVIASPVGVNKNIVNNNVGFLATSKEEWVLHFTTLILDKELQKSMGKNGHALVKKEFNRDLVFRLILDLIESHL